MTDAPRAISRAFKGRTRTTTKQNQHYPYKKHLSGEGEGEGEITNFDVVCHGCDIADRSEGGGLRVVSLV